MERLEKILKKKELLTNTNPPNKTNPQPSSSRTTNPQLSSPSKTNPQPGMFPGGLPIVNVNQTPPYSTQPMFGYMMRIKLELSKFDGDGKQSVAWGNKAEKYFEMHDVQLENEKIKYASMKHEGSILLSNDTLDQVDLN
jgi:hypothetical protein